MRNAESYSHESRRDAASREVFEKLGPCPELELPDVLAEHHDLTLGDSVNVSHALGEWGERPPARQHARIIGLSIRKGHALGIRMLDVRGGLLNVGCRFAWNFEDAGDLGPGMFRILPHNGVCYTRPTRSWVDDPRGGLVRGVEADVPRAQYISATQAGFLSERRSRNLLFNTTFGIVNLPARTGSGTSTDDLATIFDNTVNGIVGVLKRVIMTAGSPHSSDGVQPWAASISAVGGGFLTFWMYHHDDAGATLAWKLQRASDSNWWNESTRAWQAGTVNNAMPTVMTSVGKQVGARAIPSSATTYTLSIVQPSGGTAARVNRIHHVQLEERRFESSPIVREGSYVEKTPHMRDDDSLQVCNDAGARPFLKERGTMLCRFVPWWSTADVDGQKQHVFAVEYDADNSIALFYDGLNSTKNRFVLEVKAGGSTATIAAVYAVTRYTQVRIGLRWASPTYDELGDEYGTPSAGNAWYDIWAGSAVIASGQATMPTETDESRLQITCRDGQNLDACVEDFTILKTVLTAAEMASNL